jgi:hypothetical protein
MKQVCVGELGRWALGLCAGALVFSGCGPSATPTAADIPLGTAAARVGGRQPISLPIRARQDYSDKALLYISDNYRNVYVFTYPQGKPVQKLTGFIAPLGECVDPAGDVFIVASANASHSSSVIYEYAHGGTTPIAMLEDPGPAAGCAIDPTTGNLAASGDGVAVFQHAAGDPTVYSSSEFAFRTCGYDNQGNLYLLAWDGRTNDLVRLAYGSTSFEQLSLSEKIYDPSYGLPSVQWDGKHITVTSDPTSQSKPRGPLLAYRLSIFGANAKVVGTTDLSSVKNVYIGQTWIEGKTFVGMNRGHRITEVSLWRYPKGGQSRRILKSKLPQSFLWGLIVSPAQKPSPRANHSDG